jgi:hypothetical protein
MFEYRTPVRLSIDLNIDFDNENPAHPEGRTRR